MPLAVFPVCALADEEVSAGADAEPVLLLPPPLPLLPAYRAADSRSAPHFAARLLIAQQRQQQMQKRATTIAAADKKVKRKTTRSLATAATAAGSSPAPSFPTAISVLSPRLCAALLSPSAPLAPHLEAETRPAAAAAGAGGRRDGRRLCSPSHERSCALLSSGGSSSALSSPVLSTSISSSSTASLLSSTSQSSPSPWRSCSAQSLDSLCAHVRPFASAPRARSTLHCCGDREAAESGRRSRSIFKRTESWEEKESERPGDSVPPAGSSEPSVLTAGALQGWRGRAAEDEEEEDDDDDASAGSVDEYYADDDDGDCEEQQADAQQPRGRASSSALPSFSSTASLSLTTRSMPTSSSFSFISSACAVSCTASGPSAASCFSPTSPLFDSSLSGGRHSADPSLSLGISVFAEQLAVMKRLRSAQSAQQS